MDDLATDVGVSLDTLTPMSPEPIQAEAPTTVEPIVPATPETPSVEPQPAPAVSNQDPNPLPGTVLDDPDFEPASHEPADNPLLSHLYKGRDRSHIDNLDKDFSGSLQRMLNDAPPSVRDAITINSGFRSEARQKELFDEAAKKYGSPQAARRWVAPPGGSQHNHGTASDLGFGTDEARKWVHENAEKYGLTFPMGHEPWHIEPIGARDKTITKPNTMVIPSDVKTILEEASTRTGVSMDELARAAKQESDFGRNTGTGRARGMFQFMPDTWAFAKREWGDIHGIPSGASPDDPRYNAILGAEYIKYVKGQIEKNTGRYAPGEYYLGHFMGPTGGSNLIKLAQENPNAPAAASFPKAAANNRTVFYNRDGSPKTAKEVYDWGVAIGGGNAAPATIVGSGTSSSPGHPAYSPMQNAPAPIVGSVEAKKMEDARALEDTGGSYLKLAADTFRYDMTPGLLFAQQHYAPNPATIPDMDATIEKWKQAGISRSLIEKRIPEIVSGDHEDFLFKQTLAENSHYQNLAQLGVPGLGANILMSMLDPVAVGVGIASGGVADYAIAAAKFGRVARMGGQAAAGIASNLGIEGVQKELGSSTAFENPALTVAFGAAFGSLGGLLGRNPYTRVEASKIADMAEGEVRRIQDATEGVATGQRGNLSAAMDPNAERPIVNDAAIRAVSDNDVPYTAMGQFRWDLTGRLKSSPNPLVRGLGALLGEDAIGNKDKSRVNTFSADVDMQRRHDRNVNDLFRTVKPAFDDWAKERGYNAVTKKLKAEEFYDQLYEVDAGLVAKDAHGPAVQRMSAKLDELYAARAKDWQNPWHAEGLIGPAYPGFEAGAPVKNYRPRVEDLRKINEFRLNGGGDAGMEAWHRGAILSGNAKRGIMIDEDIVERMAAGIVRKKHLRADGVWENLEAAKVGDRVGLENLLHEINMPKADIGLILERVGTAEKSASDARGKHRVLLDETYVLKDYRMKDGSTRDVSIKNFVKTNPIENYVAYDRFHSGRTALMRARLLGAADPENPGKRTLLVDGFRTQGEFDAFLKHVEAKGADLNLGDGGKQMTEDIANLKFIHDRILGRPDPNLQGTAAQLLRGVRKVNFIRLMGQMGFAQAVELGMTMGTLGLKATFSQMPAFRRIVDKTTGQKVLRNELARDLEAIGGGTGEDLRGLMHFRMEDVYAPQYEGVGTKINAGLDIGQRITSITSGMHLVDGGLMLHAQKAIAQRFTDMAYKALKDAAFDIKKVRTGDLNRLRGIGLDDKMLERVLRMAKDNFSTEDGVLFSHKVTRLNLDKWSDQEARAAFEHSLYNWSRHIILRNDIGNGARWMSHPMASTLLQFRSFMMNAWAKNTLYMIHQRDMQAFAAVTWSLMTSAMVYATQMKLQSVGRSDADEFLEDRLSANSLVKAAFQRSGPSSIMPMLIDSTVPFFGYDPMFAFRSTAQPSNLLFGNPTVGLLDDLQKAGSSITQPMLSGRTTSQQDYRNMYRVLPFQNSMPLMNLYSTLISDAPERSEKLPKESRKLF